MKKIKFQKKYLLWVPVIGLSAWTLGGGISASREKAVPQALWNAVNKNGSSSSIDNGNNNSLKTVLGGGLQNQNNNLQTQNSNQNGAQENSNNNSNINENSLTPNLQPQENITEKVALKVDDVIAKYKLYSTPYESLDENTRAQVEKDLNGFTEDILKKTNLDFAFNIPEESLKIDGNATKNKDQYLSQAKSILQKNNLIQNDQTIEDGIKEILLNLSNMSKNDIEWEKTNNWKKTTDASYRELLAMAVDPAFKNVHIRLLRIVNSLNIVMQNINEGDYFKAFLAAGRAEKINAELDKFSGEIK